MMSLTVEIGLFLVHIRLIRGKDETNHTPNENGRQGSAQCTL